MFFVLFLCFGNSQMALADNSPAEDNLLALGCHNLINLSLDTANCEATVDSAMILTGSIPAGSYQVSLFYDIDKTMPVPTSPVVTSVDVGRTIIAVVTNTTSGNSCWGSIKVEDKFILPLECGDGDTISCAASPLPVLGGTPGFPVPGSAVVTPMANRANTFNVVGYDACGDATLVYRDLDIGGSTCGDFNRVIQRSWTITDAAGNSSDCVDTIYLENLSTAFDAATDCPPDWFADRDTANNNEGRLLCQDRRDDSMAGNGIDTLGWNALPDTRRFAGHPSPYDVLYPGSSNVKWFGTGTPEIGACAGVQMTFQDTRFDVCTSGPSNGCFKIIRDWLILDWCTGAVNNCQQIIKVEDNEAPVISNIADATVSVDVWRCETDWVAPAPVLTDNCSSAPLSYTVNSSAGTVTQLPDGRFRIIGLAPGTYDITYNASDCCGNRGSSTIQLTVVDEIPPVAVCDQNTVVGLTANSNPDDPNNGTSKVFATTFDDGSFDNCSDQVWFKVVRMDEFDSNGNGNGGEPVSLGDWESVTCEAANGDDDPRLFPAANHPNYNRSQSYFDDFIKVCCEDTDAPIMVVFRVFDVDPTPYEFRNQFPAAQFPQFYANSDRDPSTYTGVLPEAMAAGGDLHGRYSDCMVQLTVDDKIPPFVVAPPTVWVSCDFDFPFDPENPNDFTDEFDGIFGKVVPSPASLASLEDIIIEDRVCNGHPKFAQFAPANPATDPCYDNTYQINWGKDGYAVDNCNVSIEQSIVPNLICGKGTITRNWVARDLQGNISNTATQIINIIDCRDFFVPSVCWRSSGDRVGECNAALGQYQLISWPCDVELTSCSGVTDEAFLPENLDILDDRDREPILDRRKCNFLAATYTDTKYVLEDNACLKIFRAWSVIDWCLFDEAQANPSANITFEWNFTQVIKLINTSGPELMGCEDVTIDGFGTCNGAASLTITATDDCTASEDILTRYQIDLNNDGIINDLGYSDNHTRNPFGSLTARVFTAATPNARDDYELGTHKITWTATDGCGNSTSCSYLFTIRDAKPPTPLCLPGISTIPMPVNAGGTVDIWANDFNLKSFDNCTDSTALRYSFSDDVTDNIRTYDCAQITGNSLFDTLTIYVWDEADNFATCLVGIVLTNCDNQTQVAISGSISSEEGEDISDVMVYLEGAMDEEQMTLLNGNYNFASVPTENNYLIRPDKNVNPLNGVSTYDLVLISKHILGIEALNTPYRLIAADVNQSGTITAFDMVELRKLILFIDTEFQNNNSWRFVPSDYVFPDPLRPFDVAFPEVYALNNLVENTIADFVAIKTGDVNGSARPNLAVGSQERSISGSYDFQLTDQSLKAGEVYEIPFRTNEFEDISGFQFSLAFDQDLAAFVGLEPQMEGMQASNFGMSLLDEGIITSSFVSQDGQADETAFVLRLRAKRDVQLSDVLSINSSYTTAEAYTQSLERLDLGIAYDAIAADRFALLQNSPNPFKENTVIRFQLPYSTQASLQVYDASGRQLKLIEGEFVKGMNEITLSKSELSASGVLYYSLESEAGTATRKMILLD